MSYILHIAVRTAWDKASVVGSYTADTLESEGFIHCSNPHQLISVANFRFCGRSDLVLLCINRLKVYAEIRDENLEGGDSLFPHIYGPLNIDAVVNVFDFTPGSDGCFALPKELNMIEGKG